MIVHRYRRVTQPSLTELTAELALLTLLLPLIAKAYSEDNIAATAFGFMSLGYFMGSRVEKLIEQYRFMRAERGLRNQLLADGLYSAIPQGDIETGPQADDSPRRSDSAHLVLP